MALTATIALSSATVLINQQTNATLTVSNSGSGAINLLQVSPNAILTGDSQPSYASCALGVVSLSNGAVIAVPASGSLTLSFPCIFFSPSGSGTYSVGATIYAADGSVVSPTAATVTVNPIPLPASEL